ncbi:MAG TPA: VOC family protein [Fimbriimonadaceae bacterium]|nr:VOC family protein [Fimbriimonadaceae bacterium]
MIQGLHTIWCQASDMVRSVEFYRDVVGLPVGYESAHWTEFPLANGKLALHLAMNGATTPLGLPMSGWQVGLQTSDIVALRSRLAEAGATVAATFHDIPGGVTLDFTDPDGNPLQAVQLGVTAAALA